MTGQPNKFRAAAAILLAALILVGCAPATPAAPTPVVPTAPKVTASAVVDEQGKCSNPEQHGFGSGEFRQFSISRLGAGGAITYQWRLIVHEDGRSGQLLGIKPRDEAVGEVEYHLDLTWGDDLSDNLEITILIEDGPILKLLRCGSSFYPKVEDPQNYRIG